MKKVLSLVLILVMVLGSFTFAFANNEADYARIVEAGLFGQGGLRLDQNFTRAQFALVALRMAGYTDEAAKAEGVSANFKDVPANHFYYNYIGLAQQLGLVQGSGENFNPSGTVTYRQVVAVILRILGYGEQANAGYATNAHLDLAAELGINITATVAPTAAVKRAVIADLVDSALDVTVKGEAKTLAQKLGITPVVPAKLEVVSVSAINAKQLQVTFNQPVERTSALNRDNYTIQTNTDTLPVALSTKDGSALLTLSADAKTVTITTTTQINNAFRTGATDIVPGTPFKFAVRNVYSASALKVETNVTTLAVLDAVAPTLTTVAAGAKTTTTIVNLTFSEPVQQTGAIAFVNGVAATVSNGATPTTMVVTSGQALTAGQSYEVTLLNFQDFAGNFLNPNPTIRTFTVTADTAAPVVQEVVVVRDNLIEVTFDKSMNAATLTANARVLDLNGVQRSTITATAKANTAGRTMRLALDSVVPFNDSGVFAGNLYLGTGIADIYGNTKAPSTHSITLNRDRVAPTVTGNVYVAPGSQYAGATYANGAIVVRMSEDVTTVGTDYILINASGQDVSSRLNLTLAAGGIVVVNNSEVVIPFQALTPGLVAGNYTLRLGNAVVRDASTQTNANIAAITVVSASASADVVRPVIQPILNAAVTPATNQTMGTVIQVSFTDDIGLDLASIQDVNNYLLDGKALPAGSFILVTSATPSTVAATAVTAEIRIPARSITKDTTTAVLNVVNIKDRGGNIALPVASAVLTLHDDVSPVLTTGTIASNGLVVLGFSEIVNSVVAKDISNVDSTLWTFGTLGDFVFNLNGRVLSDVEAARVITLANGTGTDLGKYVVTITATVDAGADTNAATTTDNRLFIDLNGNGTFDQGTDILILTGTTLPIGTRSLDANLLAGLRVTTKASTSVVVDVPVNVGSTTNPLTGNTTIIVK